MKLTKSNLTKKLGVTDEVVIKLINDYKDKLPILTEEGEGFCVSARNLHKELLVGREFAKWIKERITKYELVENEDFEVFVNFDDKGGRPSTEYNITMETAKQLAMVQNNEQGRVARKYFIQVEKILKMAMEWNLIRKPERETYKLMCEELKKYHIRNFDCEPKWYQFSNEADTLNQICLGSKAKDIKSYIEAEDENTRDWLEIKYNEYLDFSQNLNIMYLRMNLAKERRYDLIKQGFNAMYPDASFMIMKGISI